jgi:hypothetical protein
MPTFSWFVCDLELNTDSCPCLPNIPLPPVVAIPNRCPFRPGRVPWMERKVVVFPESATSYTLFDPVSISPVVWHTNSAE